MVEVFGGGGVCMCVQIMQVGCQDEQQEELSALFVHSNVQLVYFNVWPACLVKEKFAPL